MAIDHSTNRDAFGHWLSGFTDGEGSFILSRFKKHKKAIETPRATFSISLRSDDRYTLKLIQEFWGVGHIYDGKARSRQWNSQLSSKYSVVRTIDLINVVVPHFEKFPLVAKKKRDFLIWKEGIKLLDLVVNRRSRRYSYQGARTKWRIEEREKFNLLVASLKEQRKFQSPIIEIPDVLPTKGEFKIKYLFE